MHACMLFYSKWTEVKCHQSNTVRFVLSSGSPVFRPASRFGECVNWKSRPDDFGLGDPQCHQGHLVLGQCWGEWHGTALSLSKTEMRLPWLSSAVGLSVPAAHLHQPRENHRPVSPMGWWGDKRRKRLDSSPDFGRNVEKCRTVEERLDSYCLRVHEWRLLLRMWPMILRRIQNRRNYMEIGLKQKKEAESNQWSHCCISVWNAQASPLCQTLKMT